jgi:hypothetical protein
MAGAGSCTSTNSRSGMARTGCGAPSALLSLRESRTSFAACPDRLAQGTSCASRKPYSSPSGATHVVLEPLDFMYRMYGMCRGCNARSGWLRSTSRPASRRSDNVEPPLPRASHRARLWPDGRPGGRGGTIGHREGNGCADRVHAAHSFAVIVASRCGRYGIQT